MKAHYCRPYPVVFHARPNQTRRVTDNIENLILEHFRAMRGDIAALTKVVSEVVLRLQAIEQAIGSIKVEIGQHYSEIALVKLFYDSLRERTERIEHRLEIAP